MSQQGRNSTIVVPPLTRTCPLFFHEMKKSRKRSCLNPTEIVDSSFLAPMFLNKNIVGPHYSQGFCSLKIRSYL